LLCTYITYSMAAGPSRRTSAVSRQQETTGICSLALQLGNVVGLCGASGNTLYWVLLLVYVGPRATRTLLGVVDWFTWDSGNAHYWVLLLVYVGPWATHFTGSDVVIQQ
jgi:hypothetical protein